jgi:hypothetical protein
MSYHGGSTQEAKTENVQETMRGCTNPETIQAGETRREDTPANEEVLMREKEEEMHMVLRCFEPWSPDTSEPSKRASIEEQPRGVSGVVQNMSLSNDDEEAAMMMMCLLPWSPSTSETQRGVEGELEGVAESESLSRMPRRPDVAQMTTGKLYL